MLSTVDFEYKQIVFALLSHGESLSFKLDNIIIKNDEGIKFQQSCYKVFALVIAGHITITSGLLQRAKKYGFSITLLTHGLGHVGIWGAKAEGNVVLRQKQYSYDKLDIAQYIVQNKIGSQLNMLKKIRNKRDEHKQAISQLKQYQAKLRDMAIGLQDLLGIEGIASRVYFKAMFADMNWKGRKPRVKHDVTNLLLDIGYTQLFNIMECMLNLYGFDVYKGVYHQTFYQRKSLVCDLVEPFRPIVDDAIKKAHALGQIKTDDFTFTQGQYRIFGKAAQPYVAILIKAILAHKEPMFLYVQSYYRAFMRDNDIADYPQFELGG